MAFVLLLLAGAAVTTGTGLLVTRGFRTGDRTGDARVHITHTWTRQPDGWVSSAHVTIDNRGRDAVVASITTSPTGRWIPLTEGSASVVGTRLRPSRPSKSRTVAHTIVAAGGSRAVAKLPLPHGPAARSRVTVEVHQPDGRLRTWRSCLPVLPTTVPAAPHRAAPMAPSAAAGAEDALTGRPGRQSGERR